MQETPGRTAIATALTAALGAAPIAGHAERFEHVDLGAVIEVEGVYSDPYEDGAATSELTLATVELGLFAQITDWLSGEVTLLFEEGDTDPPAFDVAALRFEDPTVGPWFATVGQFYVAFGDYQTNLVSDPLTLELGETREVALQAGYTRGAWSAGAFLFTGDMHESDEALDKFGASLGYTREDDNGSYAAGLSYINNLADSDGVEAFLADEVGVVDVRDYVGAWSAHVAWQRGPVTLIGEYLAVLDRFDAGEIGFNGNGARPRAYNLEVGYAFPLAGRDATAAFGLQGSREALDLGLPQRRYLASLSLALHDNATLAFEWAHDRDYDSGDTSPTGGGGSGDTADTFTIQLAVELP